MPDPYWQSDDGSIRLLHGDALAVLRGLPDKSVQCCVTSPPYWGLRCYGVDGQYGLEKTPEEYVAKMAEVFREVRRVLRGDGTLWVNMGDSYCSPPSGNFGPNMPAPADGGRYRENKPKMKYSGLKPKDLVGTPWRLAFALQNDGWYLRSDIIWAKPNPMPESVTDRPTKSHEYIFLLTKRERYCYDAEAIKEPNTAGAIERFGKNPKISTANRKAEGMDGCNLAAAACRMPEWLPSGRNARSVWTITPKPFAEAHFATFPPELPTRCIKAGCPLGGVVLDPFNGAGTTGMVCAKLGRKYIGIDLNAEYLDMSKRRIAEVFDGFGLFLNNESQEVCPNAADSPA